MNGAVSSLLNGVSALVIGGYLGVVAYQGNVGKLIDEAKHDYGYLEFLIAIIILKVIVDYKGTHDIALLLIIVALIGAALKFVANTNVNSSALQDFASGRAGLFQTLATVFGS